MILQQWLILAVAFVLAVVCMLFIKDKNEDSAKRIYLKRGLVLVVSLTVFGMISYLLPTALVVEDEFNKSEVKVIGSPTVTTQWGYVIPLDGLEKSSEYVVNKSLDTLVLFPIIYSRAGYNAYDSSSLSTQVVDIPPGEYRKADLSIATFFVVPEEDLLTMTESSHERDYALMTRPQLNILINRIVIESVATEADYPL